MQEENDIRRPPGTLCVGKDRAFYREGLFLRVYPHPGNQYSGAYGDRDLNDGEDGNRD